MNLWQCWVQLRKGEMPTPSAKNIAGSCEMQFRRGELGEKQAENDLKKQSASYFFRLNAQAAEEIKMKMPLSSVEGNIADSCKEAVSARRIGMKTVFSSAGDSAAARQSRKNTENRKYIISVFLTLYQTKTRGLYKPASFNFCKTFSVCFSPKSSAENQAARAANIASIRTIIFSAISINLITISSTPFH